MSNVLMCDSCGNVRPRSAARPEGWLSIRTLADLSHVVPDTHPLHHERHLCSVECLRDFAAQAVEGGPLRVEPLPVQAGGATIAQLADRRAIAPVVRPAEAEPTADPPVPAAASAPAGAARDIAEPAAAGSTSASDSATKITQNSAHVLGADDDGSGGNVTRLGDLIAQKLARGDAATVDLRQIAAKPAVRRRLR